MTQAGCVAFLAIGLGACAISPSTGTSTLALAADVCGLDMATGDEPVEGQHGKLTLQFVGDAPDPFTPGLVDAASDTTEITRSGISRSSTRR